MEPFPSDLQDKRDGGEVVYSSTTEGLFGDMDSDLGTLPACSISSLAVPARGTVYNQTSLHVSDRLLEDFNGVGHSGTLGDSYVAPSRPVPSTRTLHYGYYLTSPAHHPSLDVVTYDEPLASYLSLSPNLLYSDGAFQNVWSFQYPLAIKGQTTIDATSPYIVSQHPTRDSLPTGDALMSPAPALLSLASGPTSVHLPLGVLAAGTNPEGYGAGMQMHVPTRNVKSVCP